MTPLHLHRCYTGKMKRFLTLLALSLFTLPLISSTALAAKPLDKGKPSKGDNTSELIGYDVSYPQCNRSLPTDFYFAVIGVNGGTAANANPCLSNQLAWAATAQPGSKQSPKQLYVNTANPGEVIDQIVTWPKTAYDLNNNLPPNPYGNTCTGSNDLACSWLYGWNRSIYSESVFLPAASTAGVDTNPSNYRWWLDVETMNTWQSGSDAALKRNVATLEGSARYFQLNGSPVGLYSTAYQWGVITGNFISADSNLVGLANWRPSGSSLKNAVANCTAAPLTPGGYISLTQYVQRNIDKNHSCAT